MRSINDNHIVGKSWIEGRRGVQRRAEGPPLAARLSESKRSLFNENDCNFQNSLYFEFRGNKVSEMVWNVQQIKYI